MNAGAYGAAAAGSVIGALLRWGVGLALAGVAGWPWATLFVNLTGAFAIGLLAAHPCVDHPLGRHFTMTGLCGGYTTFSAFSLETLHALQGGDVGGATAYAATTIAGSLLAVWLGEVVGARL